MEKESVWRAALGEIELSISKAQFSTWFKNTHIISYKDRAVTIGVPNGFAKEWLENKFNLIVIRALSKQLGEPIREIRCRVVPQQKTPDTPQKQSIDAIRAPQKPDFSPASQGFSRKNITFSTPFTQGGASSNLNSRYTFENFIIGENNNLAHSACIAVSKNPGTLYNPLFIYGGVGLGKTHLLQSIGNALLATNAGKSVCYTTTEKFSQELVQAIREHTMDAFKKTYRDIDLLIIDDVQFLTGKEKTQHEFFNIFNALYQLDKQIVISSDRPPKSIATLEDRLKSRFEGGMIADISRPNLETRIAILKVKMNERGIHFPEETISFIAENVSHNIRELEGALNRVSALSELQGEEPSPELAQRALGDLLDSGKKKVLSQNDIIEAICTHFNVSQEDMQKKGRRKEVAHPRQIAMFFLRSELGLPYTGIGRVFGGRDHTTALHAYEKISQEIEKNLSLKEEIGFLKEKIYEY